MKKLKSVFAALTAFACLTCLFSSCVTAGAFSCPYTVTSPRVELSSPEDSRSLAGMRLSFFNGADKTVESLTLSFMLYDSDGSNPFLGSNCIVAKCGQEVPPFSDIELVVELDPYISAVPDEPYTVDYLYVREIRYDDGSVWSDPYGMYSVREAYE